jgi:hypothetical protein
MDASRSLWRQHTLQAALFSFPLALLASAYLAAVLRLPDAGWGRFVGLVGMLLGPSFAVGVIWQRRVAAPLLDWLSDSTTRTAGEILDDVLRLPLRWR